MVTTGQGVTLLRNVPELQRKEDIKYLPFKMAAGVPHHKMVNLHIINMVYPTVAVEMEKVDHGPIEFTNSIPTQVNHIC